MPDTNDPSAPQARPYLRSALFVDFDNIYLRLQQEDPRAAEQFATHPNRWLTWLRDGLPLEGAELADRADRIERAERAGRVESGPGGVLRPRRKILFRRCYLNPLHFGRYRPDFSRAAFEVVDCPPLTSSGKTSADIHMVMDILDALQHQTHFDEFILLSGDADFTPVLLRLSKHDRRSAVLAIGPAAAAFKAACDLLIDEDTFLEEAIGIVPGQGHHGHHGRGVRSFGDAGAGLVGGPVPSPLDDLLRQIGTRVIERAAGGELMATELPAIYREFPEFTSSTNWLGFKTLRQMTLGVTHAQPGLEMLEGDPWRVRATAGAEIAGGEPAAESGSSDLAESILALVRETVGESDAAVPMARLAQLVIARFGDQVLRSHWAGAGSFRELLVRFEDTSAEPSEEAGGAGFRVSPAKPGFVYDPERHQVPVEGRADELEETDPELAALAYRIHQVTDTPYLPPSEYALLFRLIAEEVTEHGFFLHRTSKAVRDRSVEEGSPIARMSINFILRGIVFSGHRFGVTDRESATDLGRCFAKNVLVLCDNAGLQLGPQERARVFGWLAGDEGEGEPARAEPGTPGTESEDQPAGAQPADTQPAEAPSPEGLSAEALEKAAGGNGGEAGELEQNGIE
ncbi:MAG TPA: NYN domain-containing protein [Thermoanaerobaculia bacterium]|nr:NYN domain-containing protein [Thermoanaerobaculia bacterium]